MPNSSYTDAGSLKALFDYLLRRVILAENVLECLLYSLTTRERSLSVPPPWCLYLTESGPCPLVLETAAGRCDLEEVRVKVWSLHPPYGDNLVEYLEPRCRNSAFIMALTQLATDIREFNIIVDEPLSGYPKMDGTIVEPPLSGRIHRKMDGIFVEAPYGELIPAERFGVRVPTDAERAALRNEDKEPPEPPSARPEKLPVWLKTVDLHFADKVHRKGPYASLGSLRTAIERLLEKKRKAVPRDRTIERGLNRHRPEWFIKGRN